MDAALRYRVVLLDGDHRAGETLAARGTHARQSLRLARGGYPGDERCPAAIVPGNGDVMTDFLQRLAERTLGLTSVAQPIIPPMFAPGPTIPDSTPATLEVDEFVESSPARSRGQGTIRPAS